MPTFSEMRFAGNFYDLKISLEYLLRYYANSSKNSWLGICKFVSCKIFLMCAITGIYSKVLRLIMFH